MALPYRGLSSVVLAGVCVKSKQRGHPFVKMNPYSVLCGERWRINEMGRGAGVTEEGIFGLDLERQAQFHQMEKAGREGATYWSKAMSSALLKHGNRLMTGQREGQNEKERLVKSLRLLLPLEGVCPVLFKLVMDVLPIKGILWPRDTGNTVDSIHFLEVHRVQ